LKSHTTRSRQHTISGPSVEQFRSISFWGWGSSKPNDADFAKVHTPDASSVPDSTLGHDGQVITQRVTPSSQSIPAVHQTSDSPSSASFVPDPGPTPFNVDASPLDQLTTPDEIPLADALDPAEALSAIPERIGYLKEVCGIDFGWGSSSMMQMLLEHIHIYGGFTWATSVVLLAVVARVVIFFPMARSSDMGAKWKATQPIIGPVRERLQEAYRAQDHAKMAEAKAEMKALNQEYGIAPMKMFLPVLIQVPLQFGGFRVLRNMAELPVPALVKEHWLWAQDLTLGDPFYILPVANAAILYLTIKVRNLFTALFSPVELTPSCSTAWRRNGHHPTPGRSNGHPFLHHARVLLPLHDLPTRSCSALLLHLRLPRPRPIPSPHQQLLPKSHGPSPYRPHPQETDPSPIERRQQHHPRHNHSRLRPRRIETLPASPSDLNPTRRRQGTRHRHDRQVR